jgi:hypothetical protein
LRSNQKAGIESIYNTLLAEYRLNLAIIKDLAKEGRDAKEIIVPAIAHGSLIHLPPDKEDWQVSRFVATIFVGGEALRNIELGGELLTHHSKLLYSLSTNHSAKC